MSICLKGISEEFFRSVLKSMPALISFEHSEVSRRAVSYLGTQKARREDSKDTRALGYSGTQGTRALGHLRHSDIQCLGHLGIWTFEHSNIWVFGHLIIPGTLFGRLFPLTVLFRRCFYAFLILPRYSRKSTFEKRFAAG